MWQQPADGESAEPRLISSLLGHSHVEAALLCLGSLLRFSAAPVRLRIHDDGSLTAADLERLAVGLRDPEVVPRREADERLAEVLATRPATRAFRSANPLALKLVDVPLLAGGDIAYCDSDVLFLRPFSRLFRLPAGAGALLMRDPQNAYSVRSWHLLREPRLRLASHVNSGVIVFRESGFDLDLVEWFLAQPRYRFAPVWVEQTCWALLAQPVGCRLLDPDAVAIPVRGRALAPRQVALHFVSPVRDLLATFSADLARRPVPVGDPIAIHTVAAPRLSAGSLAASEVMRRLRRLRPRRRPQPGPTSPASGAEYP